ncbi:MAG TPA: transglutaminase domain-containing protein [Polyangia bacterium]|jgi:tetratricopeptide (TPR) repeat protein|nr:transglutaminase domain-containing protein [Polyangia bacterium]
MRLACLGLVLIAALGCRTAFHPVAATPDPRVGPVRLVHGAHGPAVEKLLQAFYEHSFAPAEIRALTQAALAESPTSGAAHEVAAYLASLADDPHEAWLHFWLAAQDLDAPATALYLWELFADPSRADLDANLPLLDALRAQHPDPATRAAAALWQARALKRLGRLAQAEALLPEIGFIEDWALIGSFDNEAGKGFLTVLAPEQKIDFAHPVDGPLVPLRWRPAPRPTDLGAVVFANAVWPLDGALAYLATWVHVDADIDGQLRVSTGDAARAWLNGGQILSEEKVTAGDIDNLIVPVHLARGWNQLLIKSAQKGGDWWLRARFTDGRGQAIPNLRASAQPQPFKARPDSDADLQLTPAALAQVQPENRRNFLTARWLTRDGHLPRQEAPLQSFLERAPGNLLAVAYLGLAYWSNDEAGKAIDLLNQGVEQSGKDAPMFLRLRARYYLQRRLYDKAQGDLTQHLTLSPRSRSAERDLGDLFGQRGWRVDRCRQLESSVQQWPDLAGLVRDLGSCQISLGYIARGEETLRRAAALEPGSSVAAERLFDRAIEESRFPDAHAWLAILTEHAPIAPGFAILSADLARREGLPALAETEFRRAIAMNPVWPRGYERLGDLFWEQGRKAEALAEWKLARDRDPNNAVLSQRIEFHEPTRLGFVEDFMPKADAIDQALRQKFTPNPGAQVAMLMDDEITDVNADGSAKRVVTQISQALNEHGRDQLIAHEIPVGGTVKILSAYSLSKTGERQEASSIRGGEVRFRSLEVGSRVVLQYVHYAPAAHFLENHFVTTWYFRTPSAQSEHPRWVLILGKDRPLRQHIDGPVSSHETVIGDRRVITYTADEAPPLVHEPSAPPTGDLLWRVSVSTVPDWDDYVRWERALLADAFRTSPKLEALTARLTAGASTPRDKLDRLFAYVTNEIRYQQDYETTIAGVRPHACPVVLERGYGDCKDKAVLLIQLGKLAGIKLKFAILRTTSAGKMIADVPNQQFNHAIVYVPAQSGINEAFFLDPTAEGLDMGNLGPSDQGTTSLVLDPDNGAWEMIPIPFQSPKLTYTRVQLAIDVKSPTDAPIDATFNARGGVAMGLRHLLRNRSAAEKAMQGMASRMVPGATLTSSDWPSEENTGKPVSIKLKLDGARAIHAEDDHFRFALPDMMNLDSTAALDRRETPIDLGVPSTTNETVAMTLPGGYRFVHTPADFAVDDPCFSVSRKTTIGGRTATVSVDLQITCAEIGLPAYGGFRDHARDAASRLRDQISFAKGPAAVATKKHAAGRP